jgi:hypothetical protein
MRSRIVSVFTDALASAKVPVLDVASRYQNSAKRCCRSSIPQSRANTASRSAASL